jgi:hypothetical protein
MKALPRMLPVVIVGSFIFMSSQLLWTPQTSPFFSVYVGLDTVAHIILYSVLGFFVCRYLRASVSAYSAVVLGLAVSVSLTIGVIDELHQMYVPGRSAEIEDLLADLIGATGGASLYLALVGLSQWAKEFLSSSEIPWKRMLLRGAVALGAAVVICIPAVVYAATILKVCQALLLEGSLQAQQAVSRYIRSSPPKGIHLTKDVTASPQPAGYIATAAHNDQPPQFAVLGPAQILKQPRPVREHPESEAAEQQAATQKSREDVTTRSGPQTTGNLERQLLEEMQRILLRLGQLEKASKTGASSAALSAGSGTISSANVALRERIVEAPTGQGIEARKFVSPAPGVRQALGTGSSTPSPCDLVAIITSNSNPVNELTLSQARKIFSGEYTNWSQVGGPDLPVKVVTVRKPAGDLEQRLTNHFRASPSPRALRLPMVSLIIPVVAQTKGAVGFLPVLSTEQLDFVAGHTAFKRMAIKADGQSPAFEPNRMAFSTSAYPIMKAVPERHTLLHGSNTAVPR